MVYNFTIQSGTVFYSMSIKYLLGWYEYVEYSRNEINFSQLIIIKSYL